MRRRWGTLGSTTPRSSRESKFIGKGVEWVLSQIPDSGNIWFDTGTLSFSPLGVCHDHARALREVASFQQRFFGPQIVDSIEGRLADIAAQKIVFGSSPLPPVPVHGRGRPRAGWTTKGP